MNTPATPPYENKKYDLSFLTEETCRMSIPSPPELIEEDYVFNTATIMHNKRKSIPHRSPSDQIHDKSIIFQLDSVHMVPKILHGTSLLWPLRQRVLKARTYPTKRVKAMKIQIPRLQWQSTTPDDDLVLPKPISMQHHQPEQQQQQQQPTPTAAPPRRKYSHPHSGRPSRIKGPCQACQETSDGCMRKAFNWPFPTDTEFNDKGKPFVYLCNKCGLR